MFIKLYTVLDLDYNCTVDNDNQVYDDCTTLSEV